MDEARGGDDLRALRSEFLGFDLFPAGQPFLAFFADGKLKKIPATGGPAMPEGVLIFLDFDGVLRRKDAPRYRFEKPLRVAFEGAVRRIPGAEIVVTSSWREVAGLSALRRLFSLDVAARIVGVVPIGRFLEDFPRYGEVLAYLEKNGAEGREWVAVDDDSLAYPAGCSVVLVDPATGFGADEAKRLLEMAGRAGSGFSAV